MLAGNPTFFVEPDSIGLDLTDIILPPFVKGKWLDPESNRGHEDFQSSALPTELSSRVRDCEFMMAIFRKQEFIASKFGAFVEGVSGLAKKLLLAALGAVLT